MQHSEAAMASNLSAHFFPLQRSQPSGTLLIAGGDINPNRKISPGILDVLAAQRGVFAVVTDATAFPDDAYEGYAWELLRRGVRQVRHVDARDDERTRLTALRDADGVLLTGGGQLKLVESIRGTAVARRVREIYRGGGMIAGTSAGASALSDIMPEGESFFPGLRFLRRVIIDTHYLERDRPERLKRGVVSERGYLGIGVDRDTAVVLSGTEAHVVGSGRVHFVTARDIPGSINGSLNEGVVYNAGDAVRLNRFRRFAA
jgi:cyanophycinase